MLKDDDNEGMPVSCVLRVWIPDRPGALGQVASRIGAVQGDVVGIDILERGGGRAVDDIVVELPSASLIELLVHEVNEVDGVDIEEVRLVESSSAGPWLDALEAAARLVGSGTSEELIETLCDLAHRCGGASWTVVADLAAAPGTKRAVLAQRGEAPRSAWLSAFIDGSQLAARNPVGIAEASDVTWVPLPAMSLALILGREGKAFRARERRQAASLARIADSWLGSFPRQRELMSRLAHPSARL